MTQPTPSRATTGSTWTQVPTLAQAVSDWIAEEILNLRIQPGKRLTEAEVANALGVSRQPVREAMRVLAEQGLLEIIPRVGAVVAEIDPGFIVEIYEARAMVESWLIRRVVEHASDEDLARFEAEFAALIEEYGDYDPEFYDRAWEVRISLFRLAGNDFVNQLATDLRSRLRTFPRVLRVDPDHFAVYREHHSGVLAACVARDADRAALLIEEYMTRNGKRLAAILRADLQSASSDAE